MRISCEKARPSGLKLPFYRLQHPIHGLAVPAGAEHLLGDDGFIERILLDDAPEMAEDADIVIKIILHFGSHGFAPLLGGFFAGVNVVELLAEIVDSTADTGKFAFVGIRISRLFRDLYMELHTHDGVKTSALSRTRIACSFFDFVVRGLITLPLRCVMLSTMI